MQWVASAFWTLDIPASFFTAVYVNDVLRFRMRDIALNYLKSWCLYDVLMLAGNVVVLAMSETDVQAGVLRVARTRRLFRLLRVFQTIRLWKVLQAEWHCHKMPQVVVLVEMNNIEQLITGKWLVLRRCLDMDFIWCHCQSCVNRSWQGFPSLQNQLTALRARFGSLTQPVISPAFILQYLQFIESLRWYVPHCTTVSYWSYYWYNIIHVCVYYMCYIRMLHTWKVYLLKNTYSRYHILSCGADQKRAWSIFTPRSKVISLGLLMAFAVPWRQGMLHHGYHGHHG